MDTQTLNVWLSLPKAVPDTCDTLEEARAYAAHTGQPGFYYGVVNGKALYIMNYAATLTLGAVGVKEVSAK